MARKFILALIVAVGLATLVLLAVPRIGHQHLALTTCFKHLQGLEVGAKVRMEGMDMGIVRSVSVQPRDGNCPVKLDLDLWVPKDKHVPREAKTKIETAGVLGPSYVEIDTAIGLGPPIESGGRLQSVPIQELAPEDESKLEGAFGQLAETARAVANSMGDRRVVHVDSPDYPEFARQAQVSGVVTIRAMIDKEGKVVSTESRGSKLLKDVAEENCRKWLFSRSEPWEINITYDFRLEEPKVTHRPMAEVSFDLPDRVTITSHAPAPMLDGVTIKARKGSH